MTSHELARRLLNGPDLLVELQAGDPSDPCVVDAGSVDIETIYPPNNGPQENRIRISGWELPDYIEEEEEEDDEE